MAPNKFLKSLLAVLLSLLMLLGLCGCAQTAPRPSGASPAVNAAVVGEAVQKGQPYVTKQEVAAYIHKFQQLPPNFITKQEAQKLGWDNSRGNLWQVSDRKSIGGDRFANREGNLPKANGRQYYECDIDYTGGFRGAKRLVYSNDGLIFYSDDHYKTFRQLY